MKARNTSIPAAILITAALASVSIAAPEQPPSADKTPPTSPSGGRGKSGGHSQPPQPSDKSPDLREKPGAGGLPQGGRGNDDQPTVKPDENAPRDTADEGRARTGDQGDGKRGEAAGREARAGGEGGKTARLIVEDWPERPRLGAMMLIAKYGEPDSVTREMLVWRNKDNFKRICVTKAEHPHDFPKPHSDFMEHTVSYEVPVEKAGEITRFDGSVTFDRTQGELSARCDRESHNLLSLNLAHDVATGKLDAAQARDKFSEVISREMAGEKPAYLTELRFEPAEAVAAGDPDSPTIPGSPKREKAGSGDPSADARVLAAVVAVDEGEIAAASVAVKKDLSPEVMDYARMIHDDHTKNLKQTIAVGREIEVVPVETSEVEQMRAKHAGSLASIVARDGEDFEKHFVDMMVKGHTEALAKIDDELTKASKNERVTEHLQKTREDISKHLEAGKKLQAGGE